MECVAFFAGGEGGDRRREGVGCCSVGGGLGAHADGYAGPFLDVRGERMGILCTRSQGLGG